MIFIILNTVLIKIQVGTIRFKTEPKKIDIDLKMTLTCATEGQNGQDH